MHKGGSDMRVYEGWKDLFDYLDALQAGNERYRVVGERLPALIQGLALYDDRPTQRSGGFVHYTSWENMLKILDAEEEFGPVFRMYNYEMANDPEEGNIKPRNWRRFENAARDLCPEDAVEDGDENRKRSTYGCSFSTDGVGVEDDLMFWRLYGGDGNGCSLKLGVVPKSIYRVRYMEKGGKLNDVSEEGDVEARLDHLLDGMKQAISRAPKEYRVKVCRSMKQALERILEGYFHLVKSDAYAHEQEWRMISVNPDEESVKYAIGLDRIVRRYIEGEKMNSLLVSESQITLGPRVQNIAVARNYVENRVRGHGMHAARVCISSKNYRRS